MSLGIGLGLAPHFAAAQDDPARIRPTAGDLLVRVDDAELTPLAPDDIPAGAAQTMGGGDRKH